MIRAIIGYTLGRMTRPSRGYDCLIASQDWCPSDNRCCGQLTAAVA